MTDYEPAPGYQQWCATQSGLMHQQALFNRHMQDNISMRSIPPMRVDYVEVREPDGTVKQVELRRMDK